MTLGRTLRTARLSLGKTLREIESVTGISNGYLSQLESDAIKQPSPHHLYKLASAYALDYALLMESAGYVAAGEVGTTGRGRPNVTFPGLDDLSDEDRRKIQDYINDLRDARRARGSREDIA